MQGMEIEDGNQDFDYDLVTIGAGSGGVRASRVSSGTYGAKVSPGFLLLKSQKYKIEFCKSLLIKEACFSR
jgi:hypothetical protein